MNRVNKVSKHWNKIFENRRRLTGENLDKRLGFSGDQKQNKCCIFPSNVSIAVSLRINGAVCICTVCAFVHAVTKQGKRWNKIPQKSMNSKQEKLPEQSKPNLKTLNNSF